MKSKSLFSVPQFGISDSFNRNAFSARYRRHVDTGGSDQSIGQTEMKDVHLTFLPERSYKPLVEEDSQQRIREEKKAKNKEKYKKYRKNIGKALRYSWKCLMLGLQNFSVGYSTTFSAGATIVPDFHTGAAWG